MTAKVMTEPRLKAYAVGLTDVGCVRTENQDAFFVDEKLGVFAVMDGAGGMTNGAQASCLVREALQDLSTPRDAEDLLDQFERRVIEAKANIDKVAAEANGVMMGTTIAALLTFERNFACLWAGDSRVYRFRQGGLEQITTDHTEAQELVDQNVLTKDEAKTFSRRHVITKAIGSDIDLELEMVSGNLRAGDRFLLCSDGLTGLIDDSVIATILRTGAAETAAKELLAGALNSGGSDNVTVLVVDIDELTAASLEAS
ncbi:serine/threonine-protein phosphatase [Roseibium denhamense]|uniref:Protein phosphatase n=1 Tax=Roseibium denhamense TaxID=76305 RepID=A0ABY1NQX4_9HYPH|nr:protein phosphatase 2C domain-containing protein [Roseibium denhamense]MTI08024.1 serine/threonine-protein phosphatase [Roseibium denhamense]SMP15603.1 protein phosphatase [Roseibium denhamense]